MGPIQLVVFDLAGTTVEDKGVVLQSLVETTVAYHLPGTPEELNGLMGRNKREVFELLAERLYPVESAEAERLADNALAHFNAQMRAIYQRNTVPIPGTEETFAFLRSHGIKVATDTGFDAELGGIIVERLNWLGRLVDLAVYSSDVKQGRPAPYMIFHAMERLGIHDVHQVMKLGDSPADLQEGFNAGCGAVIGVLSGSHSAETLSVYPHTGLIQSVADLPTLFA